MPGNHVLDKETILEIVSAGTVPGASGARPAAADAADGHTNRVVLIRFDDGRVLVVKQGLHDWSADRFATARRASALLGEAGLRVPSHMDIPQLDAAATLAYWRIPLPTLKEAWSRIPRPRRCEVVRSWGEMLRRAHDVALPCHGPLRDSGPRGRSLQDHLRSDIGDRLLPAVTAIWPAGAALVERLLEWSMTLDDTAAPASATVVHGDMHMGNVVCEVNGDHVRCVGLIDLESAWAGPAEADLASAVVMHTPLFAQKRPHPEFESRLIEGYGDEADVQTASFFRCYHLLNIGFFSAFTGDERHAAKCARAADRELGAVPA